MKTELETWLDISDEEEHTCIYTSTEAFRDGYYVSPQGYIIGQHTVALHADLSFERQHDDRPCRRHRFALNVASRVPPSVYGSSDKRWLDGWIGRSSLGGDGAGGATAGGWGER
uniref:Uncharacterized protein n=1 Tax=Vespula pensylvanica TaxID=30213 RepID=A0A834K430_VESPE|nr:hypothetical protein H0235_015615 [Vespula pensylvanica]